MGISLKWETDAKMLLQINCQGQWTWDESDKAADDAAALIASVGHVVDVAYLLLEGPNLPQDFNLFRLEAITRHIADNMRFLIIVGGTPATKAILSVFLKSSVGVSQRTFFANSLAEATLLTDTSRHSEVALSR